MMYMYIFVYYTYILYIHLYIYIRIYTREETLEKSDGQLAARERDVEASDKASVPQVRKLVTYGNMAVLANKMAVSTRQALKEREELPSDSQVMEQKMAAAALGAEQTEQQLLRANRWDVWARCLQSARATNTTST